ncbi:MAG: hypothetical protein QOE80_459, partial [Actinomycetota bacterium]|nr:hypothetical protein [Actinomycetota bacterium]
MALPRNRRSRRLWGFTSLPHGRPRFLAALTAGFLLAGVAGAVADGGPAAPNSASTAAAGSDPAPDPGGLGLSLGGLLGRALGGTELLAPAGLGRLRVPGDVRILVVSSGADH